MAAVRRRTRFIALHVLDLPKPVRPYQTMFALVLSAGFRPAFTLGRSSMIAKSGHQPEINSGFRSIAESCVAANFALCFGGRRQGCGRWADRVSRAYALSKKSALLRQSTRRRDDCRRGTRSVVLLRNCGLDPRATRGVNRSYADAEIRVEVDSAWVPLRAKEPSRLDNRLSNGASTTAG